MKAFNNTPTDYPSGSAPGEADLIGSAKGKSDFKLLQHEDEYICSQAQIVFVWTCDWCYHLLFRCYFKHGEQYCCQRSWRRHRDEWYGQHAIYAYNTLLFSYFTLSRVSIIKAIQISQKVRVRCKCKIKTICGFNLNPYHANIKNILSLWKFVSHLTCNPTWFLDVRGCVSVHDIRRGLD